MRLRLEEAKTRCSHITDEAEESRFKIRAKGEVEVELRRLLKDELERRGVIKAKARTG